jgi:hypothetical protein
MTRTRGRPPKTQSYEFCQHLWTCMEYLRVRLARPNGRPASISYVATALGKSGGVAEIVGGAPDFLARELAFLPDARLAHATVETSRGKHIIIPVFENVGGAVWQAVLPLLNTFARVHQFRRV